MALYESFGDRWWHHKARGDEGPGYIYVYCDHRQPGVVKVGWSRGPQKRAQTLSGDSFGFAKRKWYRIHAVPTKTRVASEKIAHSMLESHRIPGPGELFHVCPAHALCAAWIAVTRPALSQFQNERLADWMYEHFSSIKRLKSRHGFRWQDYTNLLASKGLFGDHLTVDVVIKTWRCVRAQKEEDRKGRARAKYAAERQRLTKPICAAPPLWGIVTTCP